MCVSWRTLATTTPPPLATDRRIPWLLAAAFVVYGIAMTRVDRFLHDEGMLTWFFAKIMAAEPVATMFFLKSRPPLSLLYAPVSGFGLDFFLWVHIAVAALAIPLAAAVARALGQAAPNLVAAAFALSPMMLAAAPSGAGNTDAVTGLLLALYFLVVRRSPGAAGFVAGMLPFVRAEISIFVLALVAYCTVAGRRRFLLTLPGFGLAVAFFGIFYHGELFWFVHYPPTVVVPKGATAAAFGEFGFAKDHPAQALTVLLAIAPLIGLLALVPRKVLGPLERVMLWAALVFVVLIRGLPLVGLFRFDDSPRYALPLILGLLPLGRLANIWPRGQDAGSSATVVLALLTTVCIALDFVYDAPILPAVAAGWAFVWLLARMRKTQLALATTVVFALIAATLPTFTTATKLASDTYIQQQAVFAEWVLQNPERAEKCRLITNVHLLETWSHRHGLLGEQVTIEHIVNRDIEGELRTLANSENGQYETIQAQLQDNFYGRPLPADSLRPELMTGDVVFVLRREDRLERVMPEEVWGPWLTTVVERDGLWIATLTPPE